MDVLGVAAVLAVILLYVAAIAGGIYGVVWLVSKAWHAGRK